MFPVVFTVYILFSPKHEAIYIGQTTDLINRFYSHNKYGSDWTKRYRPWIVIYCEQYSMRKNALKREKKLKGGKGREWIWDKIKNEFFVQGFISA